ICFLSRRPRSPRPTLFPYTTLFRSHSGPEAWYTLSGETCLETPNGTQVGRAGGAPVIVPGGLPMELTATGSTLRKSLVLILHDRSEEHTSELQSRSDLVCRLLLEKK